MPYEGRSEGSGATVISSHPSYRTVLDEARSWAQRAAENCVIVNLSTNKPEVIVRPDGTTKRANARFRP